VAERYLYIPSLGSCLILALISERAGKATRSQIPGILLVLVILGYYGALTMDRNRDWRDEETFWSETAKTSPYDGAFFNFGILYFETGQYHLAKREFQSALVLDPSMTRERDPAKYESLRQSVMVLEEAGY
jgi:tetratricopeptide (TPR) repeat protein